VGMSYKVCVRDTVLKVRVDNERRQRWAARYRLDVGEQIWVRGDASIDLSERVEGADGAPHTVHASLLAGPGSRPSHRDALTVRDKWYRRTDARRNPVLRRLAGQRGRRVRGRGGRNHIFLGSATRPFAATCPFAPSGPLA